MNGEQALAKIRSTIQQKIAETPAVQKLIDKINSGKATYADTALYARWAAINLGMCLSGVICDIDLNDRAAVCKALMLDQYRDINGFVDIVQSELDSRFGIQLAPQRAPFNKERADTIGHSLADTTKPDEVIERRAENAVANAVESMHDDRMQAESKFRSRLGLTVVIERTGANCCPWCAEVAGKYRYGDEPEGVFRRHDNCNCTIIYDTQVLRGAVGEDGRRTKTWEEVNPEKVRGFEPDVNTPEQAKALEETALQGLTLPGQHDIMSMRMAAPLQKAPDFSKYEIKQDINAVESVKQYMIEELGLLPDQIDLKGIQNADVLEPFAKRLKKIKDETGMSFPPIVALDIIEGDRTCIASYKPAEGRLYISSRYFSSKEALTDTLKEWAANGILPKQAKSIAYLAEHESAHIRIPDSWLSSEEARDIHRRFNKSKYSNDNDKFSIYEFFADSVAWFRIASNSIPSQMAQAVEYLKKRGEEDGNASLFKM